MPGPTSPPRANHSVTVTACCAVTAVLRLRFRLRKVEELTGRGFHRTQHLAEWWFALEALDLLTACRVLACPVGVDTASAERVN